MLSQQIFLAAQKVFDALGRGHSEHIYGLALYYELIEQGFIVDREVILPITYGVHQVGVLRVDMIVRSEDEEVLLELKAQVSFTENHVNQILAYINNRGTSNNTSGMLLNFVQRDHVMKEKLEHRIDSSVLVNGSSPLKVEYLVFKKQ